MDYLEGELGDLPGDITNDVIVDLSHNDTTEGQKPNSKLTNGKKASTASNAASSSAPSPKLLASRILDKKRWHSLCLMERKEHMPLAKLVSLPPQIDAFCDAILFDSIAEIDHPDAIDSTSEIVLKKKADRKPWQGRLYPTSLDPSPETSHWYSDYQQSCCLWIANANFNSSVHPKNLEKEFLGCSGFLGFLSLQDRPYILIVFDSPIHAESAWRSKNRTYSSHINKEIILDFAAMPLPPSYIAGYHSKFGNQALSSNEDARPVILDDWRDIPGLLLIPNFLDEIQEERLVNILLGDSNCSSTALESIDEGDLMVDDQSSPKLMTKTSSTPSANWITLTKRRVQHYGYAFNYLTNNVDPTQFLGPLPSFAQEIVFSLNSQLSTPSSSPSLYAPELDQIRQVLENRAWAPDQLTINEYRPGQGIPHHIDTHSAFDEMIVSVSIMADTVMEFCHPEGKKGRKKVVLPRRSLLALTGHARYLWTHGITPRTTDQIHGKATPRQTRISLTFRNVKAIPNCDCEFPPQCDLWRAGRRSHHSKIETMHVHDVYDKIATHFDKTRYKPWPKLVSFLKDLSRGPGAPLPLVCDVGCGNGRYMGSDIYEEMMKTEDGTTCENSFGPNFKGHQYFELLRVGGDRSYNLNTICRQKGYNVVQFDCLKLPYRSRLFDATLCIAVIHHLSTIEHRVQAIEELIRVTKPGGKIIIFVWALNQSPTAPTEENYQLPSEAMPQRSFGQQDIFVPWTVDAKSSGVVVDASADHITLQRYLHVYRTRELAELVDIINKNGVKAVILEEGIDHGNCFIVLQTPSLDS